MTEPVKSRKSHGIGLAVTALVTYIIGGLGAFSGIALAVLMNGKNIWGWGDGRSIGFLLLAVGIGLSLLGVLLMRIFRNRMQQ